MNHLDNKFVSIPSSGSVTYMLFNRATLDFVKNKGWMYSSNKNKLKFIAPKRASIILKIMRTKYESM